MSFPRYPKYKGSGVEWLGELPEHWQVQRLGFACNTIVPMRDKPERLDGDIPWIRIEDFDGKYISTSKSAQGVSEDTVASMNLKVLPVGAVLCSCSCSMGATAIVAKPLVTNQTFIGIVSGGAYVPEFLFYMFHAASPHLNSIGTGAIQTYLSRDDFRQLRLPLPSSAEQTAIAAFLDRETAKIDTLIAEQQRLIELLQEKRQAVISHAVTKGLNPDAPMKDSGIEWLDVMPAHWRAMPVKHLAAQGAKTFTDGDWIESPYITDEGVRLIQTGNVGIGVYKEQGFRYVTQETYEALRCTEVKPHDVLICRLDGPVGRACLAPDLGVRMITSVDNAILKVSPDVSAAFVVALMSSLPWLSWIDALCRVGGGFRLRVSRSQLGELRVPLPPRAEQDAIMERISSHAESCNTLAFKAASAISLLQERRSALISAAVTGQIDVRGLAGSEAA
jgi:type I restriction enzyme, S subunit